MKWLKSLIVATAVQALAVTATLAGANLDQIKADGVLKIGTEGAYPPFNNLTADGKLEGFADEFSAILSRQIDEKLSARN